jgi:PAS domain S-box-containing protein
MSFKKTLTPTLTLAQILDRIMAIALQMQQCADLDAVLGGAVQETRALLNADRVLIYQLLPTADTVIAAESVGDEWMPMLKEQAHASHSAAPWQQHHNQGQAHTLLGSAATSLDPDWIAQWPSQFQVRAHLVEPILVQGQLWGWLIAHQCHQVRPWKPLDLQILQLVAVQIATAVQFKPKRVEQSFNRPPAAAHLREASLHAANLARQQAELRLQESEERFRLIFEQAGIGIVLSTAPTYNLSLSNLFFETFIGYSSDELANLSFRDITHPDDIATEESLLRDCLMGRRDGYDIEKRYICKDGTIRWGHLIVCCVRDATGQIPFGFAIVNDIGERVRLETERKQAERALRQQAARAQSLNRIMQTIHHSLDLPTILTAATTEMARLLEVEQTAIVQYLPERQCWRHVAVYRNDPTLPDGVGLEIPDQGNPFAAQLKRGEVVQVIDASTAQDEINRELAQTMPGAWLMVPMLVGDRVWGSFSLRTIQKIAAWQEAQVELAQLLANQLAIAIHQSELYAQVQQLNTNLEQQVQERTAQLQQSLDFEALLKRITDKVRDSLDERQILETVVQELAHGLDVKCCDTGIYNADQTMSTIFYEFVDGLMPVQGKTFRIDQAPHSEVYSYLFQGQACQFCDVAPNSLRSDRFLSTTLVCPILDDQGILGDLWLVKRPDEIFNDQETRLIQQVANQCAIALRQSRLYQTAQAQVAELERLSQLKDDFLSTVSHELRTPMSNIKMATQMLEIRLTSLGILDDASHAIYRYFKILREEGQREISLINDLLDLARLDAGLEPLNLTTVGLQFFIPHLAEPFLERTRNQQQQLTLHIPENLPLLITDLSYLERIITELLHNACKYTPTGETIDLSVQVTASSIEIHVSNSGVEIPAAEGDRIFDKFYRIPNNDPWKHGGTGLGLALVKRLAERIKSKIRLISSDEKTTFIVEFAREVAGV